MTQAQRGGGDPATALGTFVTYSLAEAVDFVPSWERHRDASGGAGTAPNLPETRLRTAGNPR